MVVNVHNGTSLTEHGICIVGYVQAGNVFQHVVGVVEAGQQGMLYAGFQCATFQAVDGTAGGDYGLAQLYG